MLPIGRPNRIRIHGRVVRHRDRLPSNGRYREDIPDSVRRAYCPVSDSRPVGRPRGLNRICFCQPAFLPISNLLLGILDKATLTLGDNRKVDFSHAMIFMTSNLGATEINAILKPRLGFAPSGREDQDLRETRDDLQNKISCAGLEAVRRRFTPEFVNRLDTIVVFKPLARTELRQVLEIELQGVQERIFQNLSDPFIFSVTDAGKEFLLREGTNLNYGARHLKRAIDRLVVHPMSNLARPVAATKLEDSAGRARSAVSAQPSFQRSASAPTR